MAGGRPPTYGPKILAHAKAYLKLCSNSLVEEIDEPEEDDPEVGTEIKERYNSLTRYHTRLPTKGGLARFLNVHRSTLYEWAAAHEEFSDIMEALGAEQEDRLIQGGLHGTYNSTISKVLLTKHGYADRQEVTGADGEKLFTPDKETSALVAGALNHFLNGSKGDTTKSKRKGT